MAAMFWSMFNQIAGLFMLLLLGYLMNRLCLLPKQTELVLSKLITLIFLPSLMLYTFMEECTLKKLQEYNLWILYGGLFLVLSLILAIILSKWLSGGNTYLERIFRYVLAFPNTGGVGNPIVLALYGTGGLFQFQLFLLLTGIATYVWGVEQLLPTYSLAKRSSWLHNLWNPVFGATATGTILGVSGVAEHLPQMVFDTLQRLGSCYSVVAMILVGFVIGDYHGKDILNNTTLYLIAILRLLGIPMLFLLILYLLNAPDMLLTMVLLAYACPSGMNVVVYPTAYGEDACPGAGVVLITSTLSMLTIPCMYAFLGAL